MLLYFRYLSQGTSMQVLAWNFQIGHSTVHQIIHETCKAIWDTLQPIYLKSPSSQQEWLDVAKGFKERWDFPHCLGALDGKHVSLQAPHHSGSLYYNYKKYFSIVLLAACDSKYRFIMVDIGAYGSQSDGGIFCNSAFGAKFDEDNFNVPSAENLSGSDISMPYFLVADAAFPLKKYIMRPYGGNNLTPTQRIFNYRLSRARQVIENTFGILVVRWRILRTTINAKAENVDHIIKAVTVLHNYCQIELETQGETNIYCPPGYADSGDEKNGAWRQEQATLKSVGRMAANRAKQILYSMRDNLANYLVSTGEVPWQRAYVNRGLLLQN